MRDRYDVVVAGGSIAGLLCARESAAAGLSVLVAEKSHEVGTPEHCGGLVSAAALRELGLSPGPGESTGPVDTAVVSHPPSGGSFSVPAARQNVVVVDRRRLDGQAAEQAARSGAEIVAGAELRRGGAGGDPRTVSVAGRRVGCRVVVDATGAQSIMSLRGGGGRGGSGGGGGGGAVIPCAQYVVHADWIEGGRVEVVVDAERYPGFFAWVIPMGDGIGKVGAAGAGISPGAAVEGLVRGRGGRHSVVRKIFAPVWVGGPAPSFVDREEAAGGAVPTVRAGDAAGQSKPTTAGGIFTCGMGGAMAGRAIASHLGQGPAGGLSAYEEEWRGRFGAEFARQRRIRGILSSLDNGAIGRLFKSAGPRIAAGAAEDGDFDFHALAVGRLLGLRGLLGLAGGALRAKLGAGGGTAGGA